MSGGKLPVLQQRMQGGGKGKQPQGVGHGGAGFAHLLGHLLLRQAVLLHEHTVASGFFHGVQVLPLEVFDQAQLHDLAVVRLDNDDRDLAEARQLGGPPAPFPGNDLIITGGEAAHGQRLDHPVLPDGIGQVGQRLVVKAFPGLFEPGLHL